MGEAIGWRDGRPVVPARPVVAFIEGDGIGADIWPAARSVLDSAVAAAYGDSRSIEWRETLAGEKAALAGLESLPAETVETLRQCRVGIKGPLTTPVGGGFRSLNVALRQVLDLYSCVRPVRWYGSSSPVKRPDRVDLVIFRENTEDVYAGVEYPSGSDEAARILALLRDFGVSPESVPDESAIGVKPMGPSRTKRHVRKALSWTLEKKRRAVTIMHKGNIQKYTEGAFLKWAMEVVEEPEFAAAFSAGGGDPGAVPVNDRIADNMFQQLLTRPAEYDVIVAPNLNGDYISDAAAACVGGLGMAPGANIGDECAVFEATHGTAPKYAGRDKVNPGSLILSGAMMLEFMGWDEAAARIHGAMEATLRQRKGTYDLVRGWGEDGEEAAEELKCSEFAAALAENL